METHPLEDLALLDVEPGPRSHRVEKGPKNFELVSPHLGDGLIVEAHFQTIKARDHYLAQVPANQVLGHGHAAVSEDPPELGGDLVVPLDAAHVELLERVVDRTQIALGGRIVSFPIRAKSFRVSFDRGTSHQTHAHSLELRNQTNLNILCKAKSNYPLP